MTATPSRVLAALVELWTEALDGVLVHDGEPEPGADQRKMLVVGADIDDEIEAVSGAVERNIGSLSGGLDIQCVLQVWSGDVAPGDRAALRDQAFELFRLAAEAVWETPDLGIGEVVAGSHVASWALRSLIDDQGALVQVLFPTHVDTY